MKSATLELALEKAQGLPELVQEQLGRDVLLRIQHLEELRSKIQVAVDELDAGKGTPLDLNSIKSEARQRYGRRS